MPELIRNEVPLPVRDRKPHARLLGLGEAGAWGKSTRCVFGRLRSFHMDVAHPSQHGEQCGKAPGVSAKATGGREGTSRAGVGWSGVDQTLSLHLLLFPSSLWTKRRSCLSVGPYCVPGTVLNNAGGGVRKGGHPEPGLQGTETSGGVCEAAPGPELQLGGSGWGRTGRAPCRWELSSRASLNHPHSLGQGPEPSLKGGHSHQSDVLQSPRSNRSAGVAHRPLPPGQRLMTPSGSLIGPKPQRHCQPSLLSSGSLTRLPVKVSPAPSPAPVCPVTHTAFPGLAYHS